MRGVFKIINLMAIDLTGSFFNITQQKISRGQDINFDFSVVNNGDEDIQPFDFDIVISQDENIDANDLKIGNYEIKNVLEAGKDSGLKSFRYKTPGATDPFWLEEDSTYTVGLRLDPKNKFSESNESNNSNQGIGVDLDTVEAVTFGDSDLVGLQTTLGKPEVATGSYIDLSFAVANVSDKIANPFSVDIYLSKDTKVSEGDAKLGTYDIRDIVEANSNTGVKKYSYQVPPKGHSFWESGDGKYNVLLDVDSKDEVSETNEVNNSGQNAGLDYTSINVINTGFDGSSDPADLVITSFEVPEDVTAGETVTVEYKVTNQGDSTADDFATGFYLFTEDYLGSNDSLSLEDVPGVFFLQGDRESTLMSLEAGDSATMTTELTIPEEWKGFTGPGDYYLGAEADAYDDVAENDETNNSLTEEMVDYQKVAIDNAPEATADLLTGATFEVGADTISPGSTFEVTYEIENKGNASADDFAAGFYVFTGDYLTNHDELSIGDVPEVFFLQGDRESTLISLEASKSTTMTTELTLPENWAGFAAGSGEYYVGVAADPYGDVAESDETNNSLNGLDIDYAKVNVDVIL